MRLDGNARAMLTAERSALNTVQHLSGIATMTRDYVDAMDGQRRTLLDTRKTIPGLRHLEKYATRMGGAAEPPHGPVGRGDDQGQPRRGRRRRGRGGAPRARPPGCARSSARSTGSTRSNPRWPRARPTCCSTTWSPPTLREAVALVAGRVPSEASGGVRLDTIARDGRDGVDYVSVGRLTQSAPAADIGLDFTPLR